MAKTTKINSVISSLPNGNKNGELEIIPFESKGLCKLGSKSNENLIHICKDKNGLVCIIIRGDEGDFTSLPITSDVGWEEWELSGTPKGYPAAKISGLGQPTSNDMIIELIGELSSLLESKNKLSYDKICQVILKTMAEGYDSGELMSESSCKGLYGELLFLKKLIDFSKSKDPKKDISGLISRWNGPNKNLRDFASKQNFVEVKTTGNKERVHTINNHRQLISKSGEGQGYLFSASAKWDDGASGTHFVDLINDLRKLFKKEGSEAQFISSLNNYGGENCGYFVEHEPAYKRMRKFVSMFENKLLKLVLNNHEIIDDTSWGSIPNSKPIQYRDPPKYVRGISYELDLNSAVFLTKKEENDLLASFI